MATLIAIPLLGGMTGLRTMTPMAVLCWFAWLGRVDVHGTWASWTAKLVTVIVFSFFAAGELVGDKLPQTPNRIAALPLASRLVFGGLVGALAATALHAALVFGVLLGSGGAFAGAFAGFQVRRWLVVRRGLPDYVVALVEDALAIGLSVMAMTIVAG